MSMNPSMAPPAQRQKIADVVVARLTRACYAIAVDVVNLQIVVCSTMLAGVLVSLKGKASIAAKTVVVFGFVGVLFEALFVRGKPLMDASNFRSSLTRLASDLWAGLVNVVFTAVRAIQNCANKRAASFGSQSTKVRNVFLTFMLVFAPKAHFLAGACWLIGCGTNGARARLVRHEDPCVRNIRIVA